MEKSSAPAKADHPVCLKDLAECPVTREQLSKAVKKFAVAIPQDKVSG